MSAFIASHPDVNSTYRHSKGMTLEEFRDLAIVAIAEPNTFAIVNFLRPSLGQPGAGHHSPLAAYNAQEDVMLVLDVSRYSRRPLAWQKGFNPTCTFYGHSTSSVVLPPPPDTSFPRGGSRLPICTARSFQRPTTLLMTRAGGWYLYGLLLRPLPTWEIFPSHHPRKMTGLP